MSRAESFEFEREVRRVAEALWNLGPGDCQPAWYRSDPVLSELDGIARLTDVTHVLMATTSRALDKVKSDTAKLDAAERIERKRGIAVTKWLVTRDTLNAEHLDYARKHGIKALTLDQFRRRIFDGRDYVAKRKRSAFGSARNLADSSITIPADEYVDLPMTAQDVDNGGAFGGEARVSLNDLVEGVRKGKRYVLVGPFGAGKSLTMLEVFNRLAREVVRDSEDSRTPIAVNLREHWGAQYADEILERHARSIGFSPRANVTIAWRAGIADLLLDGFDEVASQAIAQPTDRNYMKRARFEALPAVRNLVQELPMEAGLMLAGRDHYFDDRQELRDALGLSGREFTLVRLYEFDEEQAATFLSKQGITSSLPDWLPRKPLLLGYLAHQGLLDSVLEIDPSGGFGFVWDSLVELICQREAEHVRAVMDPTTTRRVLERLASMSRASISGALSALDLAEAYRTETGDAAGEGVLMQLQRFPGLTPREQDHSSRSFVDEDLLNGLQGSAVARAIQEGSTELAQRRWVHGLNRNGVAIAAYILERTGFGADATVSRASRWARSGREHPWELQLSADAVMVALELTPEGETLDAQGIELGGVDLGHLPLDEHGLTNLTLTDSVINSIAVGALDGTSIRIRDSLIGRVYGATTSDGLPSGMVVNSVIDDFDDASTNAAVIQLNIPPPMKVLITVLRKLYMQPGAGRKESALRRGLPDELVMYVGPVLHVLDSHGFIQGRGQVVIPVRRKYGRVSQIVASGAASDDPVVKEVLAL